MLKNRFSNFLLKVWFIIGVLFPFDAALLLPFSVFGTAVSVNRILLVIALFFTLLYCIHLREIRVSKIGIEPNYFILIMYSGLSISWNDDKSGAIQTFTFLFISYVLFYLGVYIKTKNLEYQLANTIIVISLIFALFEDIFGIRLKISIQSQFENEIISLFFNPAFFGATLVLSLPFILKKTLLSTKLKLAFNILINLLVIYFVIRTGSKGILVSLILVYTIFTFHFIKNKKYFIKLIITSVILTVITIYIFEKNFLPQEIKLKLYEISNVFSNNAWEDRNSSFGSRNLAWSEGINKFQEHPLFGYGIGSSYKILYGGMTNNNVLAFHNWWVQVLVETGIIGALLFTILYLKSLFRNLITKHVNSITNLSILIAFIPISLTVGNSLQLWAWWMFFGMTFIYVKEDN
jgi:O-antigen ligase